MGGCAPAQIRRIGRRPRRPGVTGRPLGSGRRGARPGPGGGGGETGSRRPAHGADPSPPNPSGAPLRSGRIGAGRGAGANRFRGANRRWGREPACKPGSVEGSHSSRTRVAARLQRPTRERRGPRLSLPYSVLLRAGFTLPPVSPPARCALTAPFHPYPRMAGGMFSVALSVGSRPPGVTWRPALRSPDFPPRRETRRSGCPADSRRPSFRLSGALRKRAPSSTRRRVSASPIGRASCPRRRGLPRPGRRGSAAPGGRAACP